MENKLSIKWNGHACFEIKGSKTILIDPFIEGNPAAIIKKEEVKADIIVVTHGHGDHVGDSLYIAKRDKVPIVTMVELAWLLKEKEPEVEFHDINFSGSVTIGDVKITAVPALHSSSYDGKFAGNPGGMIINMDGRTLYHAGDTGLFLDMELIGEMYNPEIAMLPIGGHYTMDPKAAAKAVELIKPKVAIPMHFNTFPLIQQDPNKFKELTEKNTSTKVQIMTVGQTIEI
jgi:L-ascorbate metabolism protein UlaG (beta-lactamase superfamily)